MLRRERAWVRAVLEQLLTFYVLIMTVCSLRMGKVGTRPSVAINGAKLLSSSSSSSSSSSNAFWTSLGSPRYISAPMVDQSYLPWRHLVRQHGIDLCFTQMINARTFVNNKYHRNEVIDFIDYSNAQGADYAQVAARMDRPLIVQLAGSDEQNLLQTARVIEQCNVSAIDLNLGCPQQIAKRGHYGAYLLPETDLVLKLLSSMASQLSIPVTAKIRKLPSDEQTIQLARDMESVGVAMITVHGRFLTQNKQFVGSADWDIIRRIKESLTIPVVANGGIGTLEEAHACLQATGVDAVMSSEALLENPQMFTPEGDQRFREDFCRLQLDSAAELLKYFALFPSAQAFVSSRRAHLFKILHRLLSGSNNHDLRSQLAHCDAETMPSIVELLRERFARIDFDAQIAIETGLLGDRRWYDRHRGHNSTTPLVTGPLDESMS